MSRGRRVSAALALLLALVVVAGCGKPNDWLPEGTTAGVGSESTTTDGDGGTSGNSGELDPDGRGSPDAPTDTTPTIHMITPPAEIPHLLDISPANPTDRLRAGYQILAADPPVEVLVAEFGSALDAEVTSPTDGPPSGWFTASQELLQSYATGMGFPGAGPGIRKRMDSAPADARSWYVVALGYAEDPGADGALLTATLSERPDPAVAMHLMNIIGLQEFDEATDTLISYLVDPLEATVADQPGKDPTFPLRDAAAGALRRLGFAVFPSADGSGGYDLVPPGGGG